MFPFDDVIISTSVTVQLYHIWCQGMDHKQKQKQKHSFFVAIVRYQTIWKQWRCMYRQEEYLLKT